MIQKEPTYASITFGNALIATHSPQQSRARLANNAGKNGVERHSTGAEIASPCDQPTCDQNPENKPPKKHQNPARWPPATICAVMAAPPPAIYPVPPPPADVLLKSGTIIDGTGHE